MLDARAEICPYCGVREAPSPDHVAAVDARSERPGGTSSILAALLALAGALVGSIGYVWATSVDFTPSIYTWAFAAAWGIPLGLAAVLYAIRAIPRQIGAGVLIGIGLVGLSSWLPSLIPDASSSGVPAYVWTGVAAGAAALIAGLLAALTIL